MSIGARVPTYGWEARTDGSETYAGDLAIPGTLVGRILRSPHPYAHIKSLDAGEASAMPGVQAVLTSADFPEGTTYLHMGIEHSDRPYLATDVVRHVGQEIAAVAAETERQASAALARIRVRYERLDGPLTLEESLAPKAAALHDRNTGERNVAARMQSDWGDVETALKESERVVEGTYVYPRVAHACMEPNVTVASWDRERQRIEMWTSTHAPHFIVKEVAHALRLDPASVICREIAVGGGFGSKSKISEHEVIAAALSRKAGRPVRVSLSREEEFAAVKPRHAFKTRLRTGATADGVIRAFDGDILVDNGSYNHYGPAITKVGMRMLGTLYRPLAARCVGRLVDTALPPGGQFRGYGNPQVLFAIESQVDELAEELGIDPLELRWRNANEPNSVAVAGARIGSAKLKECLATVREEIGWDRKKASPNLGRGVGVAVAMHGSGAYAMPGANRSDAAVDVHADGSICLRFGGADAGTGQRTILAQICATELGVDVDAVKVLSTDSERTPYDMGAWSSRGTHMSGHAARLAARQAADLLRESAAAKLATGDVRLEGGYARSDTDRVAIGDLAAVHPQARDGVLTVEAGYVDEHMEIASPDNPTPNPAATYAFAAHAVEVEVVPGTGEVRVLDYVAAHDVGVPLNPTQVEGQIIGGIAMGLGAALGEELIYEGGRCVNPSYLDYAMPRSADLPPIRTRIIEDSADPLGPYGAKSVGEISVGPVAPAVANAIFDAAGIRIRELPITPDKVVAALRGGSAPRRRSLWARPSRWWISGVRWAYPRGLHRALERAGAKFSRSRAPTDVPPVQAIAEPSTVEEAVDQLGAGGEAIAGGTDLLPRRQQALSDSQRLISVSELIELRRLGPVDGGGFQVGSAITLAELADAAASLCPAVEETVSTIASPQVRNVATVAGNLLQEKRCWFYRNGFDCYKRGGLARPCYAVMGDHRFYHAAVGAHRCQAVTPSDLATVFVALDAEADIIGFRGSRLLPVRDLYRGPGESTLRSDEMLVGVTLPGAAIRRETAFEKLRLWHGGFAVVSAAVSANVVDSTLYDVRIVVGAIAPTPWIARRAQSALEGVPLGEDRVRKAIRWELEREGHPLRDNAWKLEAAEALVVKAAARLRGGGARPSASPRVR